MSLTFLFIFCWVQRGRTLARSGDVLAASAVVLPVHYSILLLVAFASLFDVIYWAIDNQLLNVGQPYVYAEREEKEECCGGSRAERRRGERRESARETKRGRERESMMGGG
jgi:hypothetical protein